jgi:heme A synthase
MKWNKWIRQTHRWLTVVFTVAVIVNLVAVLTRSYTNSLGLLAAGTLTLLLLTGLYLFFLPYAARWRGGQRVN